MTNDAWGVHFVSHRRLASHAANRPPGFLRDFERVVSRRDEHGVWYDTNRPAWRELCAKYRPRPQAAADGGQPAAETLWQTWREDGGLWVADGTLRPGYAADPPQFDPLPGERLTTPAFAMEEFR